MPKVRKVRFIEPHGKRGRPFNAWIGRWPLLGLVTMATILHERGYDVAVYNENISGPLPDDPQAYQDVCSADVVGIGIMTPTAARGYALADAIKRDSPGATVVIGGVHATFLPQEAIAHADVVVRGEGETVIEDIASGRIASGIVQASPLADLDAIGPLNHSLIRDFERLASGRARRIYELPVMASRGCPFGCTYCSVSRMFGQKVRRQSPQKVARDLEHYRNLGFRTFFFYDDNLTSDRAWTRELLQRSEHLDIGFNAQVRADFAWLDSDRSRYDRDLLRLMRRCGGDVLYVGYETIDDSTAREWHKGYRGNSPLRQRLLDDTKLLHDAGFWIHGMFVLGPRHTQRTAEEIVSFSRQAQIESMQISILTPLPGTPLFEQMRPNLLFTDFPSDWDYYDGTHCVYDNGVMGVAEMQNALLSAHKRFYRWGGWSLRRLKATVAGRMGPLDKLLAVLNQARIARTTMKLWQEDTKAFLETVRGKCARRRVEPFLPEREGSMP